MPPPSESYRALWSNLLSACGAGLLERVVTLHQQVENHANNQALLDRMLEEATDKGKAGIVSYFLSNGAHITPMAIASAIDNGSPEVYSLFLSAGLDVNRDLEKLGDALICSACMGNFDLVSFLLAKGANPNSGHLRSGKYNALAAAAAAMGKSVEITEVLLEKGARLAGSGALIVAAEHGSLDLVRYLLDQGADVNEVGIEAQGDPRTKQFVGTALHKAASGGRADVVRLFLDSGADAKLLDGRGKTALQMAGNKEVEQVLQHVKSLL
ncbi:MAG: hypothetical protein MMC33_003150 [Icmadophila ericetorum]|nr:hypothetical protein [Icmadophila ericetorum]